jgi:GMP synthase-like glutamine amidotransferase
MSLDERPTLLAVQHVPWEGPHRILDACGGLHVKTVKPLAGQPLPDHDEVAGAVFMGGPMNVDEVERFPALAAERTACQAFRAGDAWGVLFHPETDFALVEAWLAVPEMIEEAVAALGDAGEHALPERAAELEGALIERTAPGFAAFAEIVARG